MQKTRAAAALALFLILVTSTPAFAAIDRDRAKNPNRDLSPIERVVQIIKRVVKPFELIVVPKP